MRKNDVIHEVEFLDLDRKATYQVPIVSRMVSVYDKESTRVVYLGSNQDFPVEVVEQTLEFSVIEQTVVVPNRKLD